MVSLPVPDTMRLFENALRRRIDYLVITGRLSERSRREMQTLSKQLDTIANVLPRTADTLALRSNILAAYHREVRRAGSVIVADGREQRATAMRLRARASAAREASRRCAARSRLRLILEPPVATLDQLRRALERPQIAG